MKKLEDLKGSNWGVFLDAAEAVYLRKNRIKANLVVVVYNPQKALQGEASEYYRYYSAGVDDLGPFGVEKTRGVVKSVAGIRQVLRNAEKF